MQQVLERFLVETGGGAKKELNEPVVGQAGRVVFPIRSNDEIVRVDTESFPSPVDVTGRSLSFKA